MTALIYHSIMNHAYLSIADISGLNPEISTAVSDVVPVYAEHRFEGLPL
jgi:hypothetical protein